MIAFLSLAVLLSTICLIAFLLLGRLDTRSEAHMHDPRHPLRDHLRTWLGITHLHEHLEGLERLMANEMLTLLQGLAAQTGELKATQQVAVVNIHNGFTRMDAAIRDLTQKLTDALANNGKVTPEMQAAADEISTALADIKKGAETADDDFEPAEDPEQPAEPGDEATGDVPTEPGTEVPPAEGRSNS